MGEVSETVTGRGAQHSTRINNYQLNFFRERSIIRPVCGWRADCKPSRLSSHPHRLFFTLTLFTFLFSLFFHFLRYHFSILDFSSASGAGRSRITHHHSAFTVTAFCFSLHTRPIDSTSNLGTPSSCLSLRASFPILSASRKICVLSLTFSLWR